MRVSVCCVKTRLVAEDAHLLSWAGWSAGLDVERPSPRAMSSSRCHHYSSKDYT